MIIVATGDSMVWGSELKDSPHGGPNGYSRNTFAALLAGPKYVCAAYPGIGNKEIVYRTKAVIKTLQSVMSDEPIGVIVCRSWQSRDNQTDSDAEIIELQTHLNSLGIPYMFTCVDNCVVTHNPLIDYTKWFLFPVIPNSGWHPNELPRGFYQWALEHKYELAQKDKHPLEPAHQDAVQLMKDTFNELVTKHLQQN
jgi:hypothetical protein